MYLALECFFEVIGMYLNAFVLSHLSTTHLVDFESLILTRAMLKVLITITIVICSFSLNSAQILKTCVNEEKENHVCKINKNYNNAIAPQIGKSPLILNSGLDIYGVTNMDENSQTLTVLMKVSMWWKDSRLLHISPLST